jgi:hypothetical protein
MRWGFKGTEAPLLNRRYGLALYSPGGYSHDMNTLLKAHFRLSRFTSQVSFAALRHFLMAGMKGETELARKVCAYGVLIFRLL